MAGHWTEEDAEFVRRLRNKGKTNKAIHLALIERGGTPRSLTSVTAFLWRYSPKAPVVRAPKAEPAAKAPRKPKEPEIKQPWAPPVASRHVDMPPEVRAVPVEAPIFYLRSRHCRYPLWKTGTRPTLKQMKFCGEPVVPGKSWCAACGKKVLIPVRKAEAVE